MFILKLNMIWFIELMDSDMVLKLNVCSLVVLFRGCGEIIVLFFNFLIGGEVIILFFLGFMFFWMFLLFRLRWRLCEFFKLFLFGGVWLLMCWGFFDMLLFVFVVFWGVDEVVFGESIVVFDRKFWVWFCILFMFRVRVLYVSRVFI